MVFNSSPPEDGVDEGGGSPGQAQDHQCQVASAGTGVRQMQQALQEEQQTQREDPRKGQTSAIVAATSGSATKLSAQEIINLKAAGVGILDDGRSGHLASESHAVPSLSPVGIAMVAEAGEKKGVASWGELAGKLGDRFLARQRKINKKDNAPLSKPGIDAAAGQGLAEPFGSAAAEARARYKARQAKIGNNNAMALSPAPGDGVWETMDSMKQSSEEEKEEESVLEAKQRWAARSRRNCEDKQTGPETMSRALYGARQAKEGNASGVVLSPAPGNSARGRADSGDLSSGEEKKEESVVEAKRRWVNRLPRKSKGEKEYAKNVNSFTRKNAEVPEVVLDVDRVPGRSVEKTSHEMFQDEGDDIARPEKVPGTTPDGQGPVNFFSGNVGAMHSPSPVGGIARPETVSSIPPDGQGLARFFMWSRRGMESAGGPDSRLLPGVVAVPGLNEENTLRSIGLSSHNETATTVVEGTPVNDCTRERATPVIEGTLIPLTKALDDSRCHGLLKHMRAVAGILCIVAAIVAVAVTLSERQSTPDPGAFMDDSLPSLMPSFEPLLMPSVSSLPSFEPSSRPTYQPSMSLQPSSSPTYQPTNSPTSQPSSRPTSETCSS